MVCESKLREVNSGRVVVLVSGRGGDLGFKIIADGE